MMKKNSKIHVWIETPLLKKLKEEAEKMGISLSDLVKMRLRGSWGKSYFLVDKKSVMINQEFKGYNYVLFF